MKKIVLTLLVILPMFIAAQDGCSFFEYRNIKVEKTEINSSQSDFAPTMVNNQLWFSAYTEDEIEKLSNGNSKNVFYNLYSSSINSSGDIRGERVAQLEDISAGYHAGPASFCSTTKELFVTLSNYDNPEIRNRVYRKAEIRLKIIIAKEIDGKWQLIEEFPFNDPTYSVGHPAISETGDTLFFASNEPDTGSGETDLYMSVRKNGEWGNPVNLGTRINSSSDDMFPFYFDGGMLFFASNRGGGENKNFDIYYSCISDGRFGQLEKVDDLNTGADDFGLYIEPKGRFGYFASRRDGGLGDDDIYKVVFAGEYNLELTVIDKNTMQPIPNAKVNFSDNIAAVYNRNTFERPLTEGETITATTQIDGYQNSSVTISTVGKPYGIIKETLMVEKVEVGQKFVMEDIYYDYDKWEILPASAIELDKLVKIMKDNPGWKVELGSHTDSRGSDSYNMNLSQKRSDSAVEYIVSNGISKDRITARGYGETQLVNRCDDGVNCNEDEHRQNRRTEFTILEMN